MFEEEVPKVSPPHNKDAHAAIHPPWMLRPEAAIYVRGRPVGINLVPAAYEMCKWLQQKGHLSLLTEAQRGRPFGATNPYSYSATSLGAQLGATINDLSDFADGSRELPLVEAELHRIRLESELTLQFARFCEACMKQMLYCTNIDERQYRKAAMGKLLAFDCRPCRKAGQPHFVSLLGALAHHYFECQVIEKCLFDHLAFIASRRNHESAHSDAQAPRHLSVADSRLEGRRTLMEIGRELVHMCQHLGTIEQKMVTEIGLFVRHAPDMPPMHELSRVPVRLSDLFEKGSDKPRGEGLPPKASD